MKRILQVVGTMDRAGAETMVMNLYRAIDKTRFQFDFVYFTERACAFDDEIIALGGHIYRIPEKEAKSPILRTYRLYQLIKKNKFHTVHCHQLFSNSFHLMAAYFAGANQRIAHSHNTSDVNSKNLVGKIYQLFSKRMISILTTDFVACGKEAGEFLFNPNKKITFIPNAIAIHKFLNAEKANRTTRFGIDQISDKTIIIAQIGRLMPVKNVEFSINFTKYLKDNKIDFHLLIAGAGPLLEELKNRVYELGLNNQITFLGVRSDIDVVLANSDILLMPSFHEGFPVILVESQAAGTPALISDRISKEVDLGLDLITFSALEASFAAWTQQLTTIVNQSQVSKKERLQTLREKGFDIEVSVKLLEKIYTQNY